MSLEPFPERVDPRKLFTRNGQISGIIALTRLQRLSEYLSSEKGQAKADLRFIRNENNQRLITGSVQAEVQMLCQRCLKETSVELEADLNVIVLGNTDKDNERARALLNDDFDAVQVEEDELDVLALIEDELILGLPIVVMHETQDCSAALNKLHEAADQSKPDAKPNAFAGLAALKTELQ